MIHHIESMTHFGESVFSNRFKKQFHAQDILIKKFKDILILFLIHIIRKQLDSVSICEPTAL